MKIECVKEKLVKNLSKVEKMTGKNVSLPILSSILFTAKNGSLNLTSTNLDLGIEINIPVKVLEEGSVAVKGDIVSNFINNIYNEKNITIESVNNVFKVITGKSETTIKTFPVEDFPIIPKVSKNINSFEIDSNELIKGLKSVYYSASVSNIKPTLSTISIYPEDDIIVFVATDSFRLAEKRIKSKKHNDFNQFLIPFKNVNEIIRTFEDIQGSINVIFDDNQVMFEFENIYLVSRVVSGAYPDYKQIIPNDFKTEVVLLKQDLINTLKISNIFSDKFSQVYFNLNPKNNLFEIKTKNLDIGENNNKIEASLMKGDSLSISFNFKYINDCFQSIESDSIGLYFGDINKPMVIKGINDKTFFYLVMPMNK